MEERLEGKTAEEWNSEGYNHRRSKRYKEALRCYNNALHIRPNYIAALNNKGFVLDELGRQDEAIKCYDRASEIEKGIEPKITASIDAFSGNVLIDSSAWIEIFKGTQEGKKALEIIEKSDDVFTSVLNLYEIHRVIGDLESKKVPEDYINTIKTHTNVIDINEKIALSAAVIRLEYKISDIEALILATARVHNLKILTFNRSFNGIEEVLLI
ncbi:MAG: PIN domain-containing protein [Halobacteriota archaeon]|nr:PIN domain-containing protein [Halobacteriota archaeon]